jgi:hypothetical protein
MSKATRERSNLPSLNISKPPEGATWNNLSRRWFVLTDRGLVPLDPQPAPPGGAGGGLTNRNPFTAAAVAVPPSLKVQA